MLIKDIFAKEISAELAYLEASSFQLINEISLAIGPEVVLLPEMLKALCFGRL